MEKHLPSRLAVVQGAVKHVVCYKMEGPVMVALEQVEEDICVSQHDRSPMLIRKESCGSYKARIKY
jgi:hypothetical protein